MIVHLLVDHDGRDRTVTAGCGLKQPRRAQDPLPENVSVWMSAVTCPECLARKPSIER